MVYDLYICRYSLDGVRLVLFITSCSVCSYTLHTSLSQLAWLQCSTPVICHTPPSITQCLCDTITHSPLPPRQHGRNMCGTYPCNVTKILLMGAEIRLPAHDDTIRIFRVKHSLKLQPGVENWSKCFL